MLHICIVIIKTSIMEYRTIKSSNNIFVVQNQNYEWGVIDIDGAIIVPFGKYEWIDTFDSGLCRVRSHGQIRNPHNVLAIVQDSNHVVTDKQEIQKISDQDFKLHPERYAKWGIINERGEEVLPVDYDEIWSFAGKNRYSVKVVKNGQTDEVLFAELNFMSVMKQMSTRNSYGYYEPRHYKEYAGSYAQDVMGYSDEVINDVFEGDPDAYWNID